MTTTHTPPVSFADLEADMRKKLAETKLFGDALDDAAALVEQAIECGDNEAEAKARQALRKWECLHEKNRYQLGDPEHIERLLDELSMWRKIVQGRLVGETK